jgi:two-component system response regulator NreC
VKRRVRVLLCDDHSLFRAGMTALLREQPLLEVVGEAADGRAAVEEVERLRPDVVLMDIEMPQLNGVEATWRITQARPDVKVLILTMHVDHQLVARCLEAGASGYVLKDVPVAQLAHAVEKVLDPRGQPIVPTRSNYDLLTAREREVLKLLADGLSIKEVAARLQRSVKTAEAHTYNLMHKLGVHHRAGLVKYAIAHQIVHVPVVDDLT